MFQIFVLIWHFFVCVLLCLFLLLSLLIWGKVFVHYSEVTKLINTVQTLFTSIIEQLKKKFHTKPAL